MKQVSLTIILAILWVVSCARPDVTTAEFPSGKITAILFLNPYHGFVQEEALPHPATYETTDGGATWKRIIRPVPGFRRGRSFASSTKGWSVDEILDPRNKIFKTEDGGQTWRPTFTAPNSYAFVFGALQ